MSSHACGIPNTILFKNDLYCHSSNNGLHTTLASKDTRNVPTVVVEPKVVIIIACCRCIILSLNHNIPCVNGTAIVSMGNMSSMDVKTVGMITRTKYLNRTNGLCKMYSANDDIFNNPFNILYNVL